MRCLPFFFLAHFSSDFFVSRNLSSAALIRIVYFAFSLPSFFVPPFLFPRSPVKYLSQCLSRYRLDQMLIVQLVLLFFPLFCRITSRLSTSITAHLLVITSSPMLNHISHTAHLARTLMVYGRRPYSIGRSDQPNLMSSI